MAPRVALPAADLAALRRGDHAALLAETGVDVDHARAVYETFCTATPDYIEAWRAMVDVLFTCEEEPTMTHAVDAHYRIEVNAAQMKQLHDSYVWPQMAEELGLPMALAQAEYRAHVRAGMTGDEARAAVIADHFTVRPTLVERLFGAWR